jgi:hypothetical protein
MVGNGISLLRCRSCSSRTDIVGADFVVLGIYDNAGGYRNGCFSTV